MAYNLPNTDNSTSFPLVNRLNITSVGAAGLMMFPANAVIERIIVTNTTANAITGGLKLGTTSGGTDVVAALTVGANALTYVTDAATLKRFFSLTAPQPIYLGAVSSWNSAIINVDIIYYQLS